MPRYFDDSDWEEERAEIRQRRERPAPVKSKFEFVELDRQELLESKIRARTAFDTFSADISRQVEQCYAVRDAAETNAADADETQALEYWNRNARALILAHTYTLRELLAISRGRELFLSGEGTLVRYKEK